MYTIWDLFLIGKSSVKGVLIKLIKIYQSIPGPWHNNCKFYPTCSNYAIEAIDKFGAFRGSIMMIYRILRCNPWSRGGYDPVIVKKS